MPSPILETTFCWVPLFSVPSSIWIVNFPTPKLATLPTTFNGSQYDDSFFFSTFYNCTFWSKILSVIYFGSTNEQGVLTLFVYKFSWISESRQRDRHTDISGKNHAWKWCCLRHLFLKKRQKGENDLRKWNTSFRPTGRQPTRPRAHTD